MPQTLVLMVYVKVVYSNDLAKNEVRKIILEPDISLFLLVRFQFPMNAFYFDTYNLNKTNLVILLRVIFSNFFRIRRNLRLDSGRWNDIGFFWKSGLYFLATANRFFTHLM